MADLGDRRFVETLRKVAEQDNDNRNRRRAVELLEDFASREGAGAALQRTRSRSSREHRKRSCRDAHKGWSGIEPQTRSKSSEREPRT